MDRKSLINQLELAYAPMTAYEFAIIKDDLSIARALERASLYAIAQRPVITFENIFANDLTYELNFEIHQKGNDEILLCKLPIDQDKIGATNRNNIGVSLNYIDKSIKQTDFPFFNIHGFSLIQVDEGVKEFLIWFSPEKLLQNWWTGEIECEIKGNFRSFLKYKIHYVGKSTKQSILKRLAGHNTFQDILSLQLPVTEKQLPANEIVILCFEFQDNLHIETFGENSDIDKMSASLRGDNKPEIERIFLDAEKALIKAMEPAYNKELFKRYPKSKDGLHQDNYDSISYTFMDPIVLEYSQGEIAGGLSIFGGDIILISNNKEISLIKHQ